MAYFTLFKYSPSSLAMTHSGVFEMTARNMSVVIRIAIQMMCIQILCDISMQISARSFDWRDMPER